MIELIQDKYETYWNGIDRHIHLEKSKENGQNIGISYVIDNDNQIESKISSKDGEVLFSYNNRLQGISVLKLVGFMRRSNLVMLENTGNW